MPLNPFSYAVYCIVLLLLVVAWDIFPFVYTLAKKECGISTPSAVQGFLFWGGNGRGFFVWGAKGDFFCL